MSRAVAKHINGEQFDSSYRRHLAVNFVVGEAIQGWARVLPEMVSHLSIYHSIGQLLTILLVASNSASQVVGDKWELTVPATLAYGGY